MVCSNSEFALSMLAIPLVSTTLKYLNEFVVILNVSMKGFGQSF